MNSKRVLICSYHLPQLDVDSYSRRLFHFVEFLLEAGWSVTCIAQNDAGFEQYVAWFQKKGVTVHVGFEENLEQMATAGYFDVAILGFWHIAKPLIGHLRRCSPATRIIIDSGDLHFLRHARRILRERDDSGAVDRLNSHYAADMVAELNTYAAADAVFAVSQKEADFVNDFVGDRARAFRVPDCEELPRSPVPFAQRRGMFFVGNFEHLPNVEAVDFLCHEVLPQFDPDLLAEHPVYVAGNAMTKTVQKWGKDLSNVRLLGWVPSITPYLERVRISLAPVLHGAGTKRKIIQALAIGTPTVATRMGIEGFDLRDSEEILIADDPVAFANAIARLLQDEGLWQRIASQGRTYMLAFHGKETVRASLLEALEHILRAPRPIRTRRSISTDSGRMSHPEYGDMLPRFRKIVCDLVPEQSTVAVVSKGDPALLDLGRRNAWHFPQGSDGAYAGFYPAEDAAVAHLEAVRTKGANYLVFPKSAFWWLEHYTDLRRHLQERYREIRPDDDCCVVFSLNESPVRSDPAQIAASPIPRTKTVMRRRRSQRATEQQNGSEAALTSDRFSSLFARNHSAVADARRAVGPKKRRRQQGNPRISVVIPTHNRAALLDCSLGSLTKQSLPATDFEIIVVDDGSTDHTASVCEKWSASLPLEYYRLKKRSGIAAAKNAGIAAAASPIIFFFDDDDVASENLLAEHLKTHERYPLENIAVLGYTGWAPSLVQTNVMKFVTEVGHYLFSYSKVSHGQRLDFTYFWGGRTSCKKSLLTNIGFFRPEFEFGSEDIELAFRASKILVQRRCRNFISESSGDDERKQLFADFGLAVIFNRDAIQFMDRPITYEQFCRRCEAQGRSQFQFAQMYDDALAQAWCNVEDAEERWRSVRDDLAAKVARVHELEALLSGPVDSTQPAALVRELHSLYWFTFDAFKTKGMVEAMTARPVARKSHKRKTVVIS
jgi:glycosyltransferase involved in cell wall biosynthesis